MIRVKDAILEWTAVIAVLLVCFLLMIRDFYRRIVVHKV